MHKISNEEFFEGIKKDLKEKESKNYEKIDNFSVFEKDVNDLYIFFWDKANKNPLENSNNIYVECKINKEEATNGCNKTIQVKRKQDNNTEKTKLSVKIPKNIQNGDKIILREEGNRDESNIGNLVVEIKIK